MKKQTFQFWLYVPVCIDRVYKYEIEAENREKAMEKIEKIKEDKDYNNEKLLIETDFDFDTEEINEDGQTYLLAN